MRRRSFLQVAAAPLLLRPSGGAPVRPRHVVIAGAGIIGISVAWHLVKRGAQVTLLEKNRPARGTTEKSFAWLNAGFTKQPRAYYDLNLLGIAGWRRLQTEIGRDLDVEWGGSVQWFPSGAESAALRRDVRNHQQWGYPARLIDSAELAALLPSIHPGEVDTACFSEIEGTVDPVQAAETILASARRLGAALICPCDVTGIRLASGRVAQVETSQGSIEADVLVVASGIGTPQVARFAGIQVPLKESPGVLAHSKPMPFVLDRIALAPGAHIKQNPDGRIVTGSDFGGTPTVDNSPESGEKLLRNAERFFARHQDLPLDNVTLGHRVMPVDEFPIVGFAQGCPNLYVAAMHSGMTLSPLIGQLAAMEILDGVAVDLLSPYRLSRFNA